MIAKTKRLENIGIWGVPRSGTSWLGQIFNSSPNTLYRFQPLFSFPFKGYLTKKSTKKEIVHFLDKIIKTNDEFIINGMLNKSEKSILNFKKRDLTHIVMKHVRYINIIENMLNEYNNIKIIGIIRNPFSVLCSWFNAENEFKKNWRVMDEWKNGQKKNLNREEEFFGYDKWKQAALLFEELNKNKNFYLLNYKNLLENTNEEVQNIFDFSNIKYTDQTKKFIEKSKSININNDYSVFKKKINDNDWEKKLPYEIVDFIKKDINNTVLSKYLS